MGGGSCYPDHPPVCEGVRQGPRGLHQQTGPGLLDRVAFPPGGVQPAVEALELSHGGPVCHAAQLPTAELCLTFPGSHGDSHRRIPLQLGWSGPVCFSSVSAGQEGSQQAADGSAHHTLLGGSVLASAGVVPGSPPGRGRLPLAPSTSPSASRSQVPSGSPHATANRMETIKRFLRHRGYSSKVTDFLAGSKRPSTLVNYQHKWRQFREWCKREGHTVSNPSRRKLVEFLVFLRQEKKLSASAIKGYRAMLNGVLALKGYDLSSDVVIREVLKTCSRQVIRPPARPPAWSVDVVLTVLRSAPLDLWIEHPSGFCLGRPFFWWPWLRPRGWVTSVLCLGSRLHREGISFFLTFRGLWQRLRLALIPSLGRSTFAVLLHCGPGGCGTSPLPVW